MKSSGPPLPNGLAVERKKIAKKIRFFFNHNHNHITLFRISKHIIYYISEAPKRAFWRTKMHEYYSHDPKYA